MASYDFYVNTYLGSLLKEDTFPGYAQRAKEYLDRLCRICRVSGGEEAKAMALCAMAETLCREERRNSGVIAATVGETSVRYGQERSLLGRLYEQAGIYLDIYRGKGD